ncbi:hypothetical protein HUO09_17590 [Vibrio sp. Y2-5]|uniref:hypothetical protein n=1 Tax=Vibrio sp. Y2-5 TaxID=2743977 RepID=UPI0016611661|nr:hypothetical protein [Vibrio sp. Y2-5]MBD0788171.1 hypothetical protein [Vibrio sp. Y2-5]
MELTVEYMQKHIHQHLNPENNSQVSNWAITMAEAIHEKNFAYLCYILCAGKGFNDKSKEALCDILNVKRTYTASGIRKIICSHCGLSEDELDTYQQYWAAKHKLERKEKTLNNTIANANEHKQWVIDSFNAGFNTIIKHNRKTYLGNSNNAGYHLHTLSLKEYAIAFVNFASLKSKFEHIPRFNTQG